MNGQGQSNMVVMFAGDSGDGIQRMGQQFSASAASGLLDVRTVADFPAEIRAPVGTVQGISSFTIAFADTPIFTTGNQCQILVAMNPAALRKGLPHLEKGGVLLLNEDAMSERDWQKAQYDAHPLTPEFKQQYQCISLPMNELTIAAVASTSLSHSQAKRCKNFFVLGLVVWLFDQSLEVIQQWCQKKWLATPELMDAIQDALLAGYNYGDTTEMVLPQYQMMAAPLPKGEYRSVTGNEAIVYACIAASALAQRSCFVGGYPITPATSILQGLMPHVGNQLTVFQAEDELAAINACIGASFGGALAMTCTSGPGLDLKTEGIGLAVMASCPLVIIDVQRAGPSTGMPTKTSQSDLLAVVHGRHGDCPCPVLAPATPAECYEVTLAAFSLAIQLRTPVFVLSDAYLANSTAPWRIPNIIQSERWSEPTGWIVPGMKGGEHVISGLETDQDTGEVSGEPNNHAQRHNARITRARAAAIVAEVPETLGDSEADYCVISWGSTYGELRTAVESLTSKVAYVHLRQCWPLPDYLDEVMTQYTHILVAELNEGHLAQLIEAHYHRPVARYNKVTGQAFTVDECRAAIKDFVQHVEKELLHE